MCAKATDSEKLDWFKIINIAGEKLTDQELRNAIYTGPGWRTQSGGFPKPVLRRFKSDEKYW